MSEGKRWFIRGMFKGNGHFPDDNLSDPLESHGAFTWLCSKANLSYFELPVLQGSLGPGKLKFLLPSSYSEDHIPTLDLSITIISCDS